MAETISELLVKITPDGVSETTDALEEQSQQFEDTAETAEEQTGRLEDFADSWQGAMATVVAGLAVAAAGLMSQVPVLGELFAGLQAIVQALAFQMDQVLRPVLQPIAQGMFGIANAISSAQGIWGTFIGIVSTLVSLALILIPAIAAVGAQLGVWASTAAGVIAILGKIISVIGTVISVIASLVAAVGAVPILIAAAVAAAIAAIYIFRDEIWAALTAAGQAILDFTNNAIDWIQHMASKILTRAGKLASEFVTWAQNLADDIGRKFRSLATTARNKVKDMADDVLDELSTLATKALNSGEAIVDSIVDGIDNKIDDVKEAAKNIAQTARDYLPFSPAKVGPLADLDDAGPGLVDTLASGMEASTPRVERASGRVATAAQPDAEGGGQAAAGGGGSGVERQLSRLLAQMRQRSETTVLELDGREMARVIEGYTGNGAVLSGATDVTR